jgi:hypothetical protein
MADLYIDGAVLERVRSSFRNITDLLGGPARSMRSVDGREIGPSPLESKVREFGSEWEYGISQLGEFSSSVVEALDAIQQSFEEADVNLAQALRDAGGGS